MGDSSYEAGRSGAPAGPNTDWAKYNQGLSDRAYQQQAQADLNKTPETAWTPPAPKVDINGVAFTILLMAPFLSLVYPVLGLSIAAAYFAGFAMLAETTINAPAKILLGLVLGIAAFFPGYKLEGWISQFKPYRFVRGLLRPINAFAAVVVLGSSGSFRDLNHLDYFDKGSGAGLFGAILVAILVHFVFRRLDRLYFPVWSQVREKEQREEKGIRDQRALPKRVLYSLMWIIPVVAILNLTIRLVVGGFTDGAQERAEFYEHYSIFVYVCDFAVWLVLSLTGILPGTAGYRKSFVDHSSDA